MINRTFGVLLSFLVYGGFAHATENVAFVFRAKSALASGVFAADVEGVHYLLILDSLPC